MTAILAGGAGSGGMERLHVTSILVGDDRLEFSLLPRDSGSGGKWTDFFHVKAVLAGDWSNIVLYYFYFSVLRSLHYLRLFGTTLLIISVFCVDVRLNQLHPISLPSSTNGSTPCIAPTEDVMSFL